MDSDDTLPEYIPGLRSGQDGFRIRDAALQRSNVEADTCTICLQGITDRAVTVPCNHLSFDFPCLAQWLRNNTTCPLCKAEVDVVQYAWRGPDDYKTFEVRRRDSRGKRKVLENLERVASASRTHHDEELPIIPEHPAVARRRRVYAEQTFSLHIGRNKRSGYTDFTAAVFAASADLQRRARTFLRRELQIFEVPPQGRLAAQQARRDWLMEYIIAILKVNEVKAADGHAGTLVAEILGQGNAGLLLHELTAWLRSPFDGLEAWDGGVQYLSSPPTAVKTNASTCPND
nr:hypothetical protein B0A51_16914 [Rachicladosporium sp. CCFEE 5018]